MNRLITAAALALLVAGPALADNTPNFQHLGLQDPTGTLQYAVQPNVISAKATIDFASTASTCSADTVLTITGAAVGDQVAVMPPAANLALASTFIGYVSATNTVKVKHCTDAATVDPASGVYTILVYHLSATPFPVSTATPTPTNTPTSTPTATPTATPTP